MRKRVKLSKWSVVMTIVVFIILFGALWLAENKISAIIVETAIGALCISALIYMPVSLSVDNHSLKIHLPLRVKTIPLADIATIQLCPPTMAERRICGSGGWFGYWGWFKEPSIGKYFAYYGKASQCFLVGLKNGKKYMLSCEQPQEMTDYIKKQIS